MSRLVVVAAGVILASVILTSCAPDPRNTADAYKIQLLADQQAADLTQLRASRSIADQQAAAERQQTSVSRIISTNLVLISLAAAGSLAVIGLGVGSGWAAVGVGRAVARAADIRTSLTPVQLSETTRQFPVMLAYLGAGRFSLANPNTGGVMMLDTRQPGDRQLMAAAGGVELAGVLAREARRSKDPEGVAVIASGVSHGN